MALDLPVISWMRSVTEVDHLFRMSQGPWSPSSPMVPSVGGGCGVTIANGRRHVVEIDHPGKTAVADPAEFPVPSVSRHPNFEVNFRVVVGLMPFDPTEGGQARIGSLPDGVKIPAGRPASR